MMQKPLPFKAKSSRACAAQPTTNALLSKMDGELAALEHRWNKTRALKPAMMQQLLNGKARLV